MGTAIADLRYFINRVDESASDLIKHERQRNLMALALLTSGGYSMDVNKWRVEGASITIDGNSAIVYLESLCAHDEYKRVLVNERGEASDMDG